MHPLAFALKRAHLSTVRFGRNMFAESAVADVMTPARYDLLAIVWGERSHRNVYRFYGESQSEIRRILGLAGATVTKMLDRLVELGLVTREREGADKRRNYISLTIRGIDCMREAFRVVFAGRELTGLYERHALLNEWPRRRRHVAYERLTRRIEMIQGLAVGLGDTSCTREELREWPRPDNPAGFWHIRDFGFVGEVPQNGRSPKIPREAAICSAFSSDG